LRPLVQPPRRNPRRRGRRAHALGRRLPRLPQAHRVPLPRGADPVRGVLQRVLPLGEGRGALLGGAGLRQAAARQGEEMRLALTGFLLALALAAAITLAAASIACSVGVLRTYKGGKRQ